MAYSYEIAHKDAWFDGGYMVFPWSTGSACNLQGCRLQIGRKIDRRKQVRGLPCLQSGRQWQRDLQTARAHQQRIFVAGHGRAMQHRVEQRKPYLVKLRLALRNLCATPRSKSYLALNVATGFAQLYRQAKCAQGIQRRELTRHEAPAIRGCETDRPQHIPMSQTHANDRFYPFVSQPPTRQNRGLALPFSGAVSCRLRPLPNSRLCYGLPGR